MNEPDPLARFWDDLLSRDSARIRPAYAALETPARRAVLAHLRRMVREPGWHPEQVISAKAALEALGEKE